LLDVNSESSAVVSSNTSGAAQPAVVNRISFSLWMAAVVGWYNGHLEEPFPGSTASLFWRQLCSSCSSPDQLQRYAAQGVQTMTHVHPSMDRRSSVDEDDARSRSDWLTWLQGKVVPMTSFSDALTA